MSGVHDSVGATERAFREAAKTAKFKFWQSVSELKVALIELGEVAIPIIVDAVKLLTGAVKLLVGDLQRIAPAVEGAHKAGQKIAEIAGPLWQKATKYATGPGLVSLWYEKVFGSGDTGTIPARQQRRIDALVNNVRKAFELPGAPSGLNISEAFGGWGKQLQSLVRLDPSKVLDSLRQGLPDTTAYMEGLASVTGRVAKAFGEGRGALESYLAGEARLRLDAKSLTEALQHQAATLGMSAEEAQIAWLANRGLGKELLKDARAAAEQIKEYRELQKVHKQTAGFMQRGQRAVQQYLSPQEKFIKRQQDLYGWLALEVITQKQFNSMLKEAKERLDALDTDVTVRFHVTGIQAVQKGTAEAAALLAEYRGGLAPGTLRRPGGKQGGIQNFVPKDLTGGGLGRGGRTDTQVVERLDRLVDIALQQLNKAGMTIEEADLEG